MLTCVLQMLPGSRFGGNPKTPEAAKTMLVFLISSVKPPASHDKLLVQYLEIDLICADLNQEVAI